MTYEERSKAQVEGSAYQDTEIRLLKLLSTTKQYTTIPTIHNTMYSKNIFVSESSMNYSDANLSESDVDSPLYNTTPVKAARNNSIDYSKFKTKMCRNYMLGLRCPFEDRCAFSHGPIPRSNSTLVATPPPPPPTYAESVNETTIADADALPTYENFLSTESPDGSQPSSPPQYPSKYRYDPYSCQGVIFEN
jgi:hypothetical protein